MLAFYFCMVLSWWITGKFDSSFYTVKSWRIHKMINNVQGCLYVGIFLDFSLVSFQISGILNIFTLKYLFLRVFVKNIPIEKLFLKFLKSGSSLLLVYFLRRKQPNKTDNWSSHLREQYSYMQLVHSLMSFFHLIGSFLRHRVWLMK